MKEFFFFDISYHLSNIFMHCAYMNVLNIAFLFLLSFSSLVINKKDAKLVTNSTYKYLKPP